MKLSMWMIANRLHELEMNLNIRENSPAILNSARRAYATNCVFIYQDGEDAVCEANGDSMRLISTNADYALELIQDTFDFYNEWESSIIDCGRRGDYQSIIDSSWFILHNPLILMDGSLNVLALSKQYGPDDADEEWNFLKNNKYPSVKFSRKLKPEVKSNTVLSRTVQYFKNDSIPGSTNCLSILLQRKSLTVGRLTLLEFDRMFNPGDYQILEYLGNILSDSLAKPGEVHGHASVFTSLLAGEHPDKNDIAWQLEYCGWTSEDEYVTYVLESHFDDRANRTLQLVRNMIQKQNPSCETILLNNKLVIVATVRQCGHSFLEMLQTFSHEYGLLIGVSLAFQDILRLKYFYDQARFAIRDENKNILDNQGVYQFYDQALQYMLSECTTEEKLAACHPAVVTMSVLDAESGSDYLQSLKVFLQFERSYVSASDELYVHRNTLVYRIRKIMQSYDMNLDDPYTREYLLISIRLREMLG